MPNDVAGCPVVILTPNENLADLSAWKALPSEPIGRKLWLARNENRIEVFRMVEDGRIVRHIPQSRTPWQVLVE